MNKFIAIGRLTKDPEIRTTQGKEPSVIARYTLAIPRRFKRDGEADADFINCVAFGKTGEFAEKFLKKGNQIAIEGKLQVRQFENSEGKKQWSTEVVVESHYFTGSTNRTEEPDELPFK